MTPEPMDFRGPIKITLKSEQRADIIKQREDIIMTLEQRSNSNNVFFFCGAEHCAYEYY